MTQKEKVQKGYKCHEKCSEIPNVCGECPYYVENTVLGRFVCRNNLIADMAGMIEEQEERIAIMAERPVAHWQDENGKPIPFMSDGLTPDVKSVGAHCSNCGRLLVGSDEYACDGKYCPACGAEMIEKAGD